MSGDYEGSCAHQSEHMGRAELDVTVELVEAGVIVLALPVVVAGSSSIASVSLSRGNPAPALRRREQLL